MKKIFIGIFVIMVMSLLLFSVGVTAKKAKKNLVDCPDNDDVFSFKLNKGTGYETYTYFSSAETNHQFLGQEQYDSDGNQIYDTYDGVCGVP